VAGLAVLLLLVTEAGRARAEDATDTPSRVAVAWHTMVAGELWQYGYFVSTLDPETQRREIAWAKVRRVGTGARVVASVAFRVRPHLGLGLEGTVGSSFVAPHEPTLERAGVDLGPPRSIGVRPFLEIRPGPVGFRPHDVWRLQIGVANEWIDSNRSQAPRVEDASDEVWTNGVEWFRAGYRRVAGGRAAVDFFAEGGAGTFSGYLGVGVGGGWG
jgi:hypothetical protein